MFSPCLSVHLGREGLPLLTAHWSLVPGPFPGGGELEGMPVLVLAGGGEGSTPVLGPDWGTPERTRDQRPGVPHPSRRGPGNPWSLWGIPQPDSRTGVPPPS